MKNYLKFLHRCVRICFVGDWRYYTWLGFLAALALVGLNASEVVSLNNFLADYQNEIFGLMVVANLAVIFYYLFRLSNASCRITKVASA